MVKCPLNTSWMGQQCLTWNSVPQAQSTICHHFERSNITKFADKHASRCNLWWTGLHDSHNTSQKYVILYLLNVHLYICILSCNIFWQASIVFCIFINEAFCDFMHKAWEWLIKLVPMPAVECIYFYELKCSALYKERSQDGLIKI